jgi:hypothetical protein
MTAETDPGVGTPTAAPAAGRAVGAAAAGPTARAVAPDARWPVYLLAGIAVGWLIAVLWSAHATITGFGDRLGAGTDDGIDRGALTLSRAALALPSVVTASLVAGVAVGLAAIGLVAGRSARRPAAAARPATAEPATYRPGTAEPRTDQRGRAEPGVDQSGTDRPPVRVDLPWRLAVGAAAGLVTGGTVAAAILIGYGTGSAIVVLAAAVGAAGTLGGLVATIRPAGMVGAAVAGTVAWFVLGVVHAAFNDRLLAVFGAANTAASRVHATSRLLFTVALTGGVIVGLVGYRYLRPWAGRLRWPVYLGAGAGPGLLLLLANLVVMVGGARLRGLAAAYSNADGAVQRYIDTAGVNTALVLLFVGGVTAMIAFGRTLDAPADDPPD